MDTRQQKIREFFSDYEARFNKALLNPPVIDVEGVADAFAPFFVEASPLGVNGGKNDEQFRAVIPQGFLFYKSIGTVSMKIASLEIVPLDGYHTMVKVHWDSRYRKPGGQEERIEFDVIYFLQVLKEKPKIFAYITGDEQKVLREKGLIPG
jgi:hypothetical protein